MIPSMLSDKRSHGAMTIRPISVTSQHSRLLRNRPDQSFLLRTMIAAIRSAVQAASAIHGFSVSPEIR